MKVKQLNRLLNNACEIITALEDYANENLQKEINALFDEIIYADEIDSELKNYGVGYSADDEAQDYLTFKDKKI